MLLRALQDLLGSVYRTEIAADVRDFLICDSATLRRWQSEEDDRPTEEKLLLFDDDGELGIALFLDAALIERLSAADPRRQLCGRNLQDFCTVLEGISHFNYVAWNAARDKRVTLLELEMQAEIDKYVAARLLVGQQDGSDLSEDLFPRLFDEPNFDPSLSAEERTRYRDASRLACQYCHSLERRFPAGPAALAMHEELRTFYRLPQPGKVSHIQSAVFSRPI